MILSGPQFPHLSDKASVVPSKEKFLEGQTILAMGGRSTRPQLWWAGRLAGVKVKGQGLSTLVTATALARQHNSTSCCRPKR